MNARSVAVIRACPARCAKWFADELADVCLAVTGEAAVVPAYATATFGATCGHWAYYGVVPPARLAAMPLDDEARVRDAARDACAALGRSADPAAFAALWRAALPALRFARALAFLARRDNTDYDYE